MSTASDSRDYPHANCTGARTAVSPMIHSEGNLPESIDMNRREVVYLFAGLTADDVPASYRVLRWTSPGDERPQPGGSR
jgi:hypothetical protein